MPPKSAGLLVFRETREYLEVLLVHPGGPFWARKDDGSWSIPKGEFEGDEGPLSVALREFREETGGSVEGDLVPLDPLRQPAGKIIYAWAVKSDFDPAAINSNTFSMEWPPRSGTWKEFPEVDRAAWFSVDIALRKILKGQQGFITQLISRVSNVT